MSLDKGAHCAKLPIIQSQILCQFYLRLKPKLCFTICAMHVYVHPRLFTREKVESVPVLPEDITPGARSWREGSRFGGRLVSGHEASGVPGTSTACEADPGFPATGCSHRLKLSLNVAERCTQRR